MNSGLAIETLGATIRANVNKSQDYLITAGINLKEARDRISSGSEPGLTWPVFLREHCGVSKSRAYELIAIADGKTTVIESRERARAGMAKMRTERAVRNVTDKPKTFTPRDIQAAHYRAACENFKALDDNWRMRFLENNGLAKTPRTERLAA